MMILPGDLQPIRSTDFTWIRDFLYERTGIVLKEGKESMVMGRLARRLRHYGLTSYGEYFWRLRDPAFSEEVILAIDLLTTNETYFFREPRHFTFLRDILRSSPRKHQRYRVWSAASSSGEEAYSLAMILAEHLTMESWEVVGTDICSNVLHTARRGLYPLTAASTIPKDLLKRYCLKGKDRYDGYFLIDPRIRENVTFHRANLAAPLPDIGIFDLIFLRNVMIYFDNQTKQHLLERVKNILRGKGYLVISHSETLHGIDVGLKMVTPSIYEMAL